MKKILHFTKGDIQIAGGYFNTTGCLACAAIRRTFMLPIDAKVVALGHNVGFQIPGKSPKTFEFTDEGAQKICSAYDRAGQKPNPDTQPFRVSIKPIRAAKFGIGGWAKHSR